MICKNCGKEIKDDSVFCPECGTKTAAPATQQPVNEEPVKEEAVAEQSVTQETYSEAQKSFEPEAAPAAPVQAGFIPPAGMPPVPPAGREPYPYTQQEYRPAPPVSYPPQPAAVPAERAVSTGIYVLMLIIGSIPLVGLIAHIIALVSSKNRSFKNYCRAYVILGIIALVIALAIAVVGYFMFDKIQDILRDFNIEIEKLF